MSKHTKAPGALPVDEVLPALVSALQQNPCALLRAPTGAGKTTRVPPALLDAGLCRGSIVLLEPRRVAARAAARRIAQERGSKLGAETGYQVRFDNKTSAATRIVAMTQGVLLRRLQDDPFLEDVSIVVFDEFHERSIEGDLALAMTRKIQLSVRPELRILLMSATLEAQALRAYLGQCPLVESRGRLFPVEVRYAAPGCSLFETSPGHERSPRAERRGYGSYGAGDATGTRLEKGVRNALLQALEENSGDILVFLPGVGEIRRCKAALSDLAAERNLQLVELYGDLAAQQQDRALLRGEQRKVILATNVAESSVTVENVATVIDSGLARVLRFDASVGLNRLELSRISQISAEQRKGRAGRSGPGLCLRLWSEHEGRSLAVRGEPEIQRSDISQAVLELRAWGERDLHGFPWFEKPPEQALQRAEYLLRLIGAIDDHGISTCGKAIAALPLQPRLGRLLIEAERLGCRRPAALLAALLSERDPLRRLQGRTRLAGNDAAAAMLTDTLARVEYLEAVERGDYRDPLLPRFELTTVFKARDHLLAATRAEEVAVRNIPPEEALGRAVLAAFPDRVAICRPRNAGSGGGSMSSKESRRPGLAAEFSVNTAPTAPPGGSVQRRAIMCGGRGVRLANGAHVPAGGLFVCVEIDAGKRGLRSEALVRQAIAIKEQWLDPAKLSESVELHWDRESERVVALRRRRYLDLTLEEKPTTIGDKGAAEALLAKSAAGALERALPLDDPGLHDFIARVNWLAQWMPELELPSFDKEKIRGLLPRLCRGRSSFAELRKAPLLSTLQSSLDYRQSRALETHAPTQVKIPSGRSVKLRYETGKAPVLAARIQELFGLRSTPRLAGGRASVLLHLLAPNGRPQQVSDDLESFWANTYPQVRKELRARYPKHAWPENPHDAPAEGPRRRRKCQ